MILNISHNKITCLDDSLQVLPALKEVENNELTGHNDCCACIYTVYMCMYIYIVYIYIYIYIYNYNYNYNYIYM